MAAATAADIQREDGGVKVEDVKLETAAVDSKGGIKMEDDPFWASTRDTDSPPSSPRRARFDSVDVKEERGSRPPISRAGSASGTSTPRQAKSGGRVKKEVVPIQRPLIDDLPLAWDEAHQTFDVLEACVYENKKMGLSREQDEMMVCDCVYDKRNPQAHQCGPNSDCVNRAIFIECLPHECRAGAQCMNQRFANRQFGNVDIVLTEKKGFGLRAASDLPAGTLIYEYIGEVVQEKTFRQRMIAYSREGIKHFYFMMLQKEEYIDATKKGGIGRFANHSCNPNCEVQKWVVGRRLRMGIFSKRAIEKGEEVTFNYNVDRYGHDAQTCYCGEPNCVGTIGGKTQTDIAGLDDLFIDALGIGAQVEAEGAKGNKKKKSRQLGEDFIPDLHPIANTEEASKVAAAIRQSSDKVRMMGFLLQRIQMTDDKLVHRQLVRAHGFSLMSKILSDMADQRDILLLALQSMLRWHLVYRNKVADSNLEEPVEKLASSQDSEIAEAAAQLSQYWSSLETEQRITRIKLTSLDADDEAQTRTIAEAQPYSYPEIRRPEAWENTQTISFNIAPIRFRAPVPSFARPPPPATPPIVRNLSNTALTERSKLDAIIAQASQFAPTPLSSSLVTSTPGSHSPAESSRSSLNDDERRKRVKTKHDGANGSGLAGPSDYELHLAEEEAMKKEKRLMKLVGEHVVQSMNKYKEMMDHETFKRYAKECTQILVDKEKRGSSYSNSRHPTLNDDKRAKIKSFTKEFVHKVLKRLKEKGKLRKPKSSSSAHSNGHGRSKLGTSHSSSSAGPETPNGHAETDDVQARTGADDGDGEADMEMDLDDIFGKDDDGSNSTRPSESADARSAPTPSPVSAPVPVPLTQTPRRTSRGSTTDGGLAPVDTWCAPKAPRAHLAAAARANGA